MKHEMFKILAHALGGENPSKWYRNHFVANSMHHDWDVLCQLEREGLMARFRTPAFCSLDNVCFYVTEQGKEALRVFIDN
jgi:hypothetical protein